MSTALSQRSVGQPVGRPVGRPVRRALTAAAAVAAAALVVVPAPTQAAPATTVAVGSGSASWGLSTYLNSANMGRPNPLATGYVAPAAFNATSRISSWGTPTGTVTPTGAADVTFAGTSVNFAPTGGGWLRLSAPKATVDGAGNGTLSAVVSYGLAPGAFPNIVYDANQAAVRGPVRVNVVDLVGNTAADVTSAGTTSTYTGLDGAWSPQFTAFLAGDAGATPAIAGWAYASTVSSAADRTPLPLTFSVGQAVPGVTVTTAGQSYDGGLTLGVTGTGFSPVTNAGDNGVYVGIAPSGGLPNVSSMDNLTAFAAAAWVPAAQFAAGGFTASVTAPTLKLDPAKKYSVYTWQAHSHSNTTQDTETPLAIAFNKFKTAPEGTFKVTKKPTTTARGKLVAKVSGPAGKATGKVTVKMTNKGIVKIAKKTLKNGKAVVVLPKLTKGTWKVKIVFGGKGYYATARKTMSFTVK